MPKYNIFEYLRIPEKEMRHYFSENHRKYSEACQKEVEEMSMNPLTAEEKEAQMDRNRRISMLRALGIKESSELEKENDPSSLPGD